VQPCTFVREIGQTALAPLFKTDRTVVDRAIILARSGEISPKHLRIERFDTAGSGDCGDRGKAYVKIDSNDFSLRTAEREFILRALRETGWQRTRAAALLGITRATLHAKLKRYEITEPARGEADSSISSASPVATGN